MPIQAHVGRPAKELQVTKISHKLRDHAELRPSPRLPGFPASICLLTTIIVLAVFPSVSKCSDEFPVAPAKHLSSIQSIPPRDQIVLEVRIKFDESARNEIGVFDLTTHNETKWDVLNEVASEEPPLANTAHADWSPTIGRLLFATQQSVRLISRDGTVTELHPKMPGTVESRFGMLKMGQYALSTDGKTMAYVLYMRDQNDKESDRFGKLYMDLMYQQTEGSPPVSVWNDQSPVLRPTWRPDGAAIAHTNSDNNLVVSDLSGKILWSFHPGPPSSAGSTADYIDEIRWDPSGKRLAFLMGFPIRHLYVVNADGGGNQVVEFHGSLGLQKDLSVLSFAWSPDGKKFVLRVGAGKECNYAGGLGYKFETGHFPCIYAKSLLTADVDGSHLIAVSKSDYEFGELFWIQ
jgi:WD40 repeat protein